MTYGSLGITNNRPPISHRAKNKPKTINRNLFLLWLLLRFHYTDKGHIKVSFHKCNPLRTCQLSQRRPTWVFSEILPGRKISKNQQFWNTSRSKNFQQQIVQIFLKQNFVLRKKSRSHLKFSELIHWRAIFPKFLYYSIRGVCNIIKEFKQKMDAEVGISRSSFLVRRAWGPRSGSRSKKSTPTFFSLKYCAHSVHAAA